MDCWISPEERALLEAVDDTEPDPIVDFDALFIPVGPNGTQDLQLIAPYPVTVDAEHVQLPGSRFWNDPAGGKKSGIRARHSSLFTQVGRCLLRIQISSHRGKQDNLPPDETEINTETIRLAEHFWRVLKAH